MISSSLTEQVVKDMLPLCPRCVGRKLEEMGLQKMAEQTSAGASRDRHTETFNMSVDFWVKRKDIPFAELLPRLQRHGITKMPGKYDSERSMFLTDNEHGGCWVYVGEDGMLDGMTCYAPNGDPSRVLCATGEAFNAQVQIIDYDELEAALNAAHGELTNGGRK